MSVTGRDILRAPLLFLRACRQRTDGILNRILFAVRGVKLGGAPEELNGIICIRRSRKGSIELGRGIKLNSGGRYNIIAPDKAQRCVLRTIGEGRIRIGDNVGISNSALVAAASITIGDHAMIGGGCRIWDTDFHPLDAEERNASYEAPGKSAPVEIGESAFIGADSIILKGVNIGRRAVIGAGSVVRCDVGDDEVWAGNPAVRLRSRQN